MFFELALSFFIGILVGTFTGVFPGIHINLISTIILSSLTLLEKFSPESLIVFITTIAITHTFLDFIPSIYLGAPEEDNFLSVLPGHQLLRKGQAHSAVVYTLYGSLTALPIILILTFIFIKFLPSVYNATEKIIPLILIFLSIYIIFRDKEFLISLTVFILSGFLGFLTFNTPVKEPLLPLLSGLFGLSSLIISIKNKTQIPKQKILPLSKIKLSKKEFLKSSLASFISAPLCSFLPGIGSGHAAVLGSEIFKQNKKEFLFSVGAINVIVLSLSFVVAFIIGKTRTGASAVVKEILNKISQENLILILITIFITGIITFFIAIKISKLCSNYINNINYSKLSIITILILISLNLILTNYIGLIVLITSTSLGIFTILSNTRRINLMGCLLVPTIIYYLTL